MGNLRLAAENYKKALDKCENDQKLQKSSTFKKAGTNYAIALEKLGKRNEAVTQLESLKRSSSFGHEVLINNNLGTLQKRKGEVQKAIDSYQEALKTDPKAFFPNYNLAVLLATEAQYSDALKQFQSTLTLVHSQPDKSYLANVLLNLAQCCEQLKSFQQALDYLK